MPVPIDFIKSLNALNTIKSCCNPKCPCGLQKNICPKCTIVNNAEMFQFGLLSSDYINNMNSSNSMHKLDMIPEFEITSSNKN